MISFGGIISGLLRSKPASIPTADSEVSQSTFLIGSVVGAFGLSGLVAIFLWGHGLSSDPSKGLNTWTIFSADVLVAGAAAAVGGLLGFIFGIPRTLDAASRVAVATASSQEAASSQAALSANTNLERISDWFTTLLIGATLVQIKDVTSWIGKLGANLTSGAMLNENIVPVIAIYFSALSFTGIYLITRLYLTYALQQTLVLLTGSSSQPSVQTLKSDIMDALASGNVSDLIRASDQFESWKFKGNDLYDVGLNYNAARLYAQLIKVNPASDRKDAYVKSLGNAVQRASMSADVKKKLGDDLSSGWLSSGNPDVDANLKKKIAL